MKQNSNASETKGAAVAMQLSVLLADMYVLSAKTRNAHWNVVGTDFYAAHHFFEKQYNELDEMIDEIAERIRSIGHYAPASLKKYLELTHLTEQNRSTNSSEGFINELVTDHESIIVHLKENSKRLADEFHDSGTDDFMTGLLQRHEKMAWMLRAHLKPTK